MENEKLDISSIIKSASNNKQVLDILKLLFVTKTRERNNAISDKNHFDRYFSLSLLPNDIANNDFEEAFNLNTESLGNKLISFNQLNSPVLAYKLFYKFSNIKLKDKESFNKIIEALFLLYESIVNSKDQFALMEGVNLNNLRKLIVDLYKNAEINETEKDQIFIAILRRKRENYSFLSIFINLDFIFFWMDLDERRNKFNFYRDLQLEYLKRAISNSTDNLVEVLTIIQQLHRFIKEDKGVPSSDDVEWFKNNVLINNIEYIDSKLKDIYKYIKNITQFTPLHEDKELGKEIIREIFHDISNLDLFNSQSLNEDTQAIIDYYNDYIDCNEGDKFIHNSNVSKKYSGFNEEIEPVMQTNNYLDLDLYSVKLFIQPIDTEYWKLDINFILNNINKNQKVSLLRIKKGHLESGASDNLFYERKLHFIDYLSEIQLINKDFNIFDNYNNENLIIEIFKKNELEIKIDIKSTNKKNGYIIKRNDNFNKQFKMYLWCDSNNFKIDIKIKRI